MAHENIWYKDEDKETKSNPQKAHSLFVLDRGDMMPVLHKVKVPGELAGLAGTLDETMVELLVDIRQTNFNGKPATEFRLLKGKVVSGLAKAA